MSRRPATTNAPTPAIADLREEDVEGQFWMLLNESQARELAAGRVPEPVREMARTMIDWMWDLARGHAQSTKAGR